ncbi:MAG: hypothetical protein RLZZ450_1874 [Pseudomonadota bacterium]
MSIGQPLDRERRCLGEDVRLGCTTGTDISCESIFAPTNAEDARGQPFRIVNGCAPAGYTKHDDVDDSRFWQHCPP